MASTKKIYVVQGNYGYGWDDLTTDSVLAAAKKTLSEYRANEKRANHRIITRTTKIVVEAIKK